MGILITDSFDKFKDLVETTDEYYIAKEEAKEVVNKIFYRKNMKEAFDLAISLHKDYHNPDRFRGYPIERIPIELWLKKSDIKNAIDAWHDELFTDWWNTEGNSRIAERYIKKRGNKLEKINEFKLRKYYFPEQVPEKLTIYRGIKQEYDPEHQKKFTSWTLDKDQGLRFAKWHFVKGYSPKGHESEVQYLLEKEIDIKDMSIFIGGEEHEVIMLSPTIPDKITKLN